MSNQPMSYKERLTQNQEQKDEMAANLSAKEGELQLQTDILQTERTIALCQSALEKAKNSETFNSQALINFSLDLEEAEKQLAILTALKSELFPA